MITTREIPVKITDHNYQYYDDLGYDTVLGETIVIPVELLPKGSHYKITCKCDGCGIEKQVIYKNYLRYGNNFGEYYCRKCSEHKRIKTLRKNFGVDYPIQNKGVLGKMKKTIMEKYGVDNISKKEKRNE
jgi:hypothetical protein